MTSKRSPFRADDTTPRVVTQQSYRFATVPLPPVGTCSDEQLLEIATLTVDNETNLQRLLTSPRHIAALCQLLVDTAIDRKNARDRTVDVEAALRRVSAENVLLRKRLLGTAPTVEQVRVQALKDPQHKPPSKYPRSEGKASQSMSPLSLPEDDTIVIELHTQDLDLDTLDETLAPNPSPGAST